MKNVLLSIIVALTAATSVFANVDIHTLLENDDVVGLLDALEFQTLTTPADDLNAYIFHVAKLHNQALQTAALLCKPHGVCLLNDENQTVIDQRAAIVQAADDKYKGVARVLLVMGARIDVTIEGTTAATLAGNWLNGLRSTTGKGNPGARQYDTNCKPNGCNYK
jgi:hypothetical protein